MPRYESRTTASSLRIRLDPAVPWEALLARRLETLAPSRRGAWIRNLLVAGFREECAVCAQLADEAPRSWRSRSTTQREAGVTTSGLPASADRQELDFRDQRPFAALAAIIG